MVHNMSKTKIVVLHLKEIIYTAIFAGLGILLIILLIVMFLHKNDSSTPTMSDAKYTPGKYSSTVKLNDTNLNLEIVLDENHIKKVGLVNIDEAVTTMYPLVEPCLNNIAEQLYNDVDIDSIEASDDNKFTQELLVNAIKFTLEKATPQTAE